MLQQHRGTILGFCCFYVAFFSRWGKLQQQRKEKDKIFSAKALQCNSYLSSVRSWLWWSWFKPAGGEDVNEAEKRWWSIGLIETNVNGVKRSTRKVAFRAPCSYLTVNIASSQENVITFFFSCSSEHCKCVHIPTFNLFMFPPPLLCMCSRRPTHGISEMYISFTIRVLTMITMMIMRRQTKYVACCCASPKLLTKFWAKDSYQ